MRCEATLLEKTIFKHCYFTDGSINLMCLDWIDELPCPVPTTKQNLPDIYFRNYECGKCRGRMQPVSTRKPDSLRTQI
ncbi:unnamed protein product [Hymenolepis diminuta]|uniref:Uncharacterized protein n=1 Tax=Hymenolepis diminuta TaxID=6216 RepID=A0A0R3SNB7_HYMDI|nr:unnamed protein product [Hymenolepis diminuta]